MYNTTKPKGVAVREESDGTLWQQEQMETLPYIGVTKTKSVNDWLRDPNFARTRYFMPDAIISGKGEKNYQRA
jgi:hypothetical protein